MPVKQGRKTVCGLQGLIFKHIVTTPHFLHPRSEANHRNLKPVLLLQLEARSENAEDELLSVVTVKQGRKIVCGSQGGVLSIYSWGAWNDCSDRFPGHPASVDALVRLDEDTLITGSSDGLLRIVSILPNKMLGVLGEHADYPIERLGTCAIFSFLSFPFFWFCGRSFRAPARVTGPGRGYYGCIFSSFSRFPAFLSFIFLLGP
jgi:hypothetical protein